MKAISPPKIIGIDYVDGSKKEIRALMHAKSSLSGALAILYEYPTVYVIYDKRDDTYSVYVGETANIAQRTVEHLKTESSDRKEFDLFKKSKDSKMLVIGHEHFNKSLTLDVENRLIHYLFSLENVKVCNRKTNQQNKYFTSEELDEIFRKIWKELHKIDSDFFPLERVIRDSALFKASPFHKLTEEQLEARSSILYKILEANGRKESGQLILVEGEAGSGKTVLMSSLFYELKQLSLSDPDHYGTNHFLLVNHDQQMIVYEQLAKKLGLGTPRDPVVMKPTKFINSHLEEEKKKVDVVIVDEGHLLLTQGKQSYRGKNQLEDLLKRAKVVVAVYDPKQVLTTEQYIDERWFVRLRSSAQMSGNLYILQDQLRINANQDTIDWIRSLIVDGFVRNIPKDDYDLKVFDSPQKLYKAICRKAINESKGISRVLATYDWEYKLNTQNPDGEYWEVKIGEFHKPWNYELNRGKRRRNDKGKTWAEQKQTIYEVGSTFSIQGFDLNYAGVILGPSVVFKDGKISFDPKQSKNKKATQQRTTPGGMIRLGEELLRNELNVLLTRGVNGLYIYACDKTLREALLSAQKGLQCE